jgi:hypothetical protein
MASVAGGSRVLGSSRHLHNCLGLAPVVFAAGAFLFLRTPQCAVERGFDLAHGIRAACKAESQRLLLVTDRGGNHHGS